jgi:hypothetical protein
MVRFGPIRAHETRTDILWFHVTIENEAMFDVSFVEQHGQPLPPSWPATPVISPEYDLNNRQAEIRLRTKLFSCDDCFCTFDRIINRDLHDWMRCFDFNSGLLSRFKCCKRVFDLPIHFQLELLKRWFVHSSVPDTHCIPPGGRANHLDGGSAFSRTAVMSGSYANSLDLGNCARALSGTQAGRLQLPSRFRSV